MSRGGGNGTGETGEAVSQTVLDEILKVVNSTSDADKLKVITTYVDLDSEVYGTVTSGSTLQNVPAGYYLIKDKDDTLNGVDEAYTTYIVEVVNNVTIAAKSAKPTVDKQIQDEIADAEAGATNGWGETADHAINESFQMKLTATLSADTDFAAYETYKVVFTDTMSKSLTFEKIESVTVDEVVLQATDYVSDTTKLSSDNSWTLTIEDIKAIEGVDLSNGAVIEVIYSAHLNESAAIGNEDDNYNTVYLEYSNNPNAGGSGELGKTEEDTVWVFTYEMPNTKTDESNNALAGAGFRLYDESNQEIELIYDDALEAYRPVKEAESGVEMTSAEDGSFNIVGLDAGTYILKETTTPAGYNTCEDITIVISATHAEDDSTTTASTSIAMTQDGTLTTANTIVNKAGTTLPETGGIGTTMFYVIGAILVIGAGIVMITRKRMSAEK